MHFRKKNQDEDDPLKFIPTDRQKLFAACYFCVPQYKFMEPEDLCKELGMRSDSFTKWRKDPDFEEWLEDQRGLFSKGPSIKKAMLEYVGMQKAVEGDFQFWKPLSIREGVINPDMINHGISVNLEAFNDFTAEQIEQHSDSLLRSIYALEDQGRSDVAEGISQPEPESDTSGTVDAEIEPLEIPK